MKRLGFEEFLRRVRRFESVSRFDFEYGFEWDEEKSARFVRVLNRLEKPAHLCYADLRYASLCSAHLRSADLRYASLCSADLCSAHLRSADLRYANLRYASLRGADCEEVEFEEASFVLACGDSFAELLCSLKNASQEFKNYLYVQTLAHTKPKLVLEALSPKHVRRIKAKKKKEKVV